MSVEIVRRSAWSWASGEGGGGGDEPERRSGGASMAVPGAPVRSCSFMRVLH